MNKQTLIDKTQQCMNSEAEYTEFVEYEYMFIAHYFSVMKPKNILIFGGFTNIDAFIASSLVDSTDMHITNIDFSGNPDFLQTKQNYYKNLFEYKGTYTLVNEYVDVHSINLDDYDLVWDNIKCAQLLDLSKIETLILTHYQSPKSYIWKDYINQKIPLTVELRSLSVFANVENRIRHNLHSYFDFPCEKQKIKYKDQIVITLDHLVSNKIQWQKDREHNLMAANGVEVPQPKSSTNNVSNYYESFDFLKNG